MKTGDIVVMATLLVAFVALVTAHVWIVVGLASRAPRWRSVLALIAVPLAPYWALRERMTARGVTWLLSAATYAVAWVIAARG